MDYRLETAPVWVALPGYRILPPEALPQEGVPVAVDASKLTEPAEMSLRDAVVGVPAGTADGDVAGLLDATAPVVAAAARFFDNILVNAEDPAVRAARQGLLASVLALAPAGVDWKSLDVALG